MNEFVQGVGSFGANFWDWLTVWIGDRSNWGGFLATILSGMFALISFVVQRGARRDQKLAEARLRVVQEEDLRAKLDQQTTHWGCRVITLLAEVEMFAQAPAKPDWREAKNDLVCRLSAATDHGRLFFPNVSHDVVGVDRPFANRGYRQPILDALMLGHERLRRLDRTAANYNGDTERAHFNQVRRAFVSELQRALDPRRRKVIFENLADSSKLEDLGDDVVWDVVAPLVAQYETEYGERSFWRDGTPKARRALMEAARGTAEKS